MGRSIKGGATNVSTIIRILTSGEPVESVTSATPGLSLWYRREGGTVTAIVVSDLGTVNAVHSDGGLIHIGAGYYRLDVPDAAFATGVGGVLVGGTATALTIEGTYCQIETDSNINIYNDQTYNGSTGYTITTGSKISGTAADTLAIGTPLVFAPSGVAVLDVNFEFEAYTLARASQLVFTGYYDRASGLSNQAYAEVYLWNYVTTSWEKISKVDNRIADGTANSTRVYTLATRHQSPSTGTIKVRYVSSRTDNADRLYVDQHFITAAGSGPTASEIALAVADRMHADFMPDWGSVTAVNGTAVTMSGDYFQDQAGLYNGRVIQFRNTADETYEVRRVVSQAAGGILTLDRAPVIITASGWHGYVLPQIHSEDGSGLTNIPKTGYKLAADGLDTVSTVGPNGVATNFRERLNQLYRRFFGKVGTTKTVLTTYRDDGVTPATTQAISADSSSQALSEATDA